MTERARLEPPEDASVVRFEVRAIEPVSQGEVRSYGHGRVSHGRPAHHRRLMEWRSAIERAALDAMAGRPPFEGPVGVDAVFHATRPLTHFSARKRSRPLRSDAPMFGTSGLDLDKCCRGLLDGLGGGAGSTCFADDSQVVVLHALRRYADAPGDEGASVAVWPLLADEPETVTIPLDAEEALR